MLTLTLYNYLLGFIYFFAILFFGWIYAKRKMNVAPLYRFYFWGLLAKLLGGIVYVFIYVYYYSFGDTFLYHRGGMYLRELFFENPIDYFRVLFSSHQNISDDLLYIKSHIAYSKTAEEFFMVKITSFLSLVSFDNYIIITLFCSLLAFYGSWLLFKVFSRHLSLPKRYVFAAILLIPSVTFFASGLMKDTISYGALCILFYLCYKFVILKQRNISCLLYILLVSYLIYGLKSYIIIAFVPSIGLMYFSSIWSQIDSKIIRIAAWPILILMIAGGTYFGAIQLAENSEKYQLSSIQWKLKGFHTWHETLGGSFYSLGEVSYTPLGMIEKIPAALNVTFFRPYLWEVTNIVTVFSALESLLFFLLFIYLMYKIGFVGFYRLFKFPLFRSAFIFVVLFGFSVGFTSYNFGALGRYKAPCMPFFMYIILVGYERIYRKKQLIT